MIYCGNDVNQGMKAEEILGGVYLHGKIYTDNFTDSVKFDNAESILNTFRADRKRKTMTFKDKFISKDEKIYNVVVRLWTNGKYYSTLKGEATNIPVLKGIIHEIGDKRAERYAKNKKRHRIMYL